MAKVTLRELCETIQPAFEALRKVIDEQGPAPHSAAAEIPPLGTASARPPIPEPFRKMFWVAAEDIANVIGCTVVEGEPRGYSDPDPRDAEIERLRGELAEIRAKLAAVHDAAQYDDITTVRAVEMLAEQRDSMMAGWGRCHAKHIDQRAEFDRQREDLHRIREMALVVLDRLPDDEERSAVDLVREILTERNETREERAGWRTRAQEAEAERDRLRQLVGDENVGPNWTSVDRFEAIRQANDFHADRLKWMEEHDRRRDERDEALAERDRLALALTEIREDFTAAINGALNAVKPAEPRRWVAGDPEPEIGTTVRSARGRDYLLLKSGYWHELYGGCDPNSCRDAGYSWSWLTGHAEHLPLVEVVSTDG